MDTRNFNYDLDLVLDLNNLDTPFQQRLNLVNFDTALDNTNIDENSNTNLDIIWRPQEGGGPLLNTNPIIAESFNKKWCCKEKTIKFNLKNLEFRNFFEANALIEHFFKNVFQEYVLPINPNHLVRYTIDHDMFEFPISTPFMQRKNITASMIQGEFSLIFQSAHF